ncbi:acetyl-CoA carboxylase biotin carboxylase subunit family protein [Aeromicrobium sp. CTD01-1L150]|uniref:ATP-grasp domain-containing protein n=1 Tax=Aeromicrobium sp. CTD01-1L150 TaxID=3341830 RepID=UPI0035BF18A9
METNIFVLGLDQSNLETLEALPHADYRFHALLDKDRLMNTGTLDLATLLGDAQAQLEAFPGSVDAIVGYWDFPVSAMVPMLCRRLGLPSVNLDGLVKCEHKYWSRLEQQKVIEEVPSFAIIDPFEDDALPEGMDFPVWIKPVKSTSSELAFHLKDQQQLDEALAELRDGIAKFGKPFEFVMSHVDLPPHLADIGAMECLVEADMGGHQVTVEGFEFDGVIEIYGIIDSVTRDDTPSFLRYQYPSTLPEHVRSRMADLCKKVIGQIGLRSSTFNIEFFWEPDGDRVQLLEVNPRHSQSHDHLFQQVDGVANHEAMVRLALGLSPDLPHRRGQFAMSAKWMLRRVADATVVRVPTPAEVAEVERAVDGVSVDVVVAQGDRLSDLTHQDSYSYELANIYVGAADEAELTEKYERCVAMLPWEFDE